MLKFNCKTIALTYANRDCASLFSLGFAAGLPYTLLFVTLSMWLREAGVSLKTIGFISLVGLVYAFKWVWASVVDQVNLPLLHKLGRRKSYLLLSQIILFLSLIALALNDPSYKQNLGLFLICSLLVALASATQDNVIDAYRLEIASTKQQAALAASYITGYRLALLLAGAGAIWLAQYLGSNLHAYSYQAWRNTYLLIALCLIPIIIISFLLKEPQVRACNQNDPYTIWHKLGSVLALIALLWSGFAVVGEIYLHLYSWLDLLYLLVIIACLSSYGRKLLRPTSAPIIDLVQRYKYQAILLLAIIATYRFSDTVLGVMANVFYLDLGFSKEQIASITKVFGLIMTLSGAAIGGVLILRFKILTILLVGAILCSATNLLFYLLEQVGPNWQLLVVTISCDNLSAGIASTAFVAYLSSITNLKFSAAQYAFLSSVMLLLPRLVGGYSGVLVTNVGYGNFFILTAIMGIPTILLILWQIYLTKNKE